MITSDRDCILFRVWSPWKCQCNVIVPWDSSHRPPKNMVSTYKIDTARNVWVGHICKTVKGPKRHFGSEPDLFWLVSGPRSKQSRIKITRVIHNTYATKNAMVAEKVWALDVTSVKIMVVVFLNSFDVSRSRISSDRLEKPGLQLSRRHEFSNTRIDPVFSAQKNL